MKVNRSQNAELMVRIERFNSDTGVELDLKHIVTTLRGCNV